MHTIDKGFSEFMSQATRQELQESINELTAYRDRLHKEVINIGKKLKLHPKNIESTVQNHEELANLERVLKKLHSQLAADGNN